MKKILISFAAGLFTCLASFSQSTTDNNPEKAYFGIRVGGEITCPGNISADHISIDAFKNGGGIELGGIFNVPLKGKLYIEPGLKLYYNSYSVRKDILKEVEGSIKPQCMAFNKYGIRIPVVVGYKFDIYPATRLSIFTGPEMEIGLDAREKITADKIKFEYNLYSEDDGLKRIDVLWSIGAGISYKKFYFGLTGNIGMINMLSWM